MPPIRVLHLADIHLGTELYGRVNPATGLSTRVEDFLASLDEAVEAALSLPVELVLFCGDAYRTRDPNPTYQREFALRVRRLSSAGIPVFLLVGNHDLPVATGRASSVEIFSTLQVPNVYVARKPGTYRIETARGPVQVAALPWVLRSALLTKEEYKNKSLDEINQATAEKIERIVRSFVEGLDPAVPAIMAAHVSVMGAVYGSEKTVSLGQDIVLPKSLIADPSFDYVALGHVHKHQVVSTRPLAVYPGSLERIDFGEEREDKGYIIAEVERGGATYTFHPVNARRFLTIEVSAMGEDPMAQVLEAIAAADVAGTIVRLRIHTTEEKEPFIIEQELRRALREAYHVAGVAKVVERRSRSRWSGHALQQMSPSEALATYLKYKGYPDERQELLRRYGEEIIRGHPL